MNQADDELLLTEEEACYALDMIPPVLRKTGIPQQDGRYHFSALREFVEHDDHPNPLLTICENMLASLKERLRVIQALRNKL